MDQTAKTREQAMKLGIIADAMVCPHKSLGDFSAGGPAIVVKMLFYGLSLPLCKGSDVDARVPERIHVKLTPTSEITDPKKGHPKNQTHPDWTPASSKVEFLSNTVHLRLSSGLSPQGNCDLVIPT